MSSESFATFQLAVLADPALQEPLKEAVDWPAFAAVARRLSRELGCPVEEEDLREAEREARLGWLMRWL